ncbi:ABC transporter permease [Demequina sp. TTPB684]|uniref:ABC transporter permease n=1 Tax=unclassified Demequina TaxID=2620311 RepID=UPI001CF304AA|nr:MULTISPECIES: ABC transporter permease [unclassified Demequina]MCB2413465.1 ABC transporter permease [Demequina sp. TTPB684]UPU88768.1 ABC transporter permease [Demequina sp. TMPB413]
MSTPTDTAAAPAKEGKAPQASAIVSALASTERPQRPGPLSTSLTFGWRALLKIKHVPEQLFDVTAFPIIMTSMFSVLFGGALAGSTEDYVQFFLPGIMVQSLIMITMYTGHTLRTDIEKGVFDRFRSLPIWRPSALVGMLLGDTVRFTIAAIVTSVVGLLLGWRPGGGLVGVVLGVVLILVFAFSLGWIWTFLSLLLRSANSIMGVSMMIITPITFGSNIFVDPSTMPGWLQAWVEVNPVSHLVTSVRDLMGGTPVGSSLLLALLWSAGLVAVFGSLTMWKYRDPR